MINNWHVVNISTGDMTRRTVVTIPQNQPMRLQSSLLTQNTGLDLLPHASNLSTTLRP